MTIAKRWIMLSCLGLAALATWTLMPRPPVWTVLANSDGEPRSMVAAPDGTVYVTFLTAPGVHAISSSGARTRLGPFHLPGALALAADGALYVADSQLLDGTDVASSVILKRQRDGSLTRLAPGPQAPFPFNLLMSMALDKAGNLYANDLMRGPLFKITQAGDITRWAEARGIEAIAVDLDQGILMTHRDHAIVKRMPDGAVRTYAGKFGACGWVDGPVASARFCEPSGIAVSSAGDAYVIDQRCRVRTITQAGMVSTLFGNPDAPRPGVPSLPPGLCPLHAIATGIRGELYLAGREKIMRLDEALKPR